MRMLPPLLLLTASVALGLFLGWQYLRRVRANPVHIGVHLILGFAGLEVMALMLRGAPDGTAMSSGSFGQPAALLLLMAVVSGLLTPMIAKRSPRKVGSLALAVHAGIGAAGFILFLAWARIP